jgi:hypothetical protein
MDRKLQKSWGVDGLALVKAKTKPELRALLRLEAQVALDRLIDEMPDDWAVAPGLMFNLEVRPLPGRTR